MTMSRAQTLIAEVLKTHAWYFVGNLGVPGMADRRGYKCPCGWSTGDPDSVDFEDPHDHVAQAGLVAIADDLVAGVNPDGIPWLGLPGPGGDLGKVPGPGDFVWFNDTAVSRTFTDIPGWNRGRPVVVPPGKSLTVEAPEWAFAIEAFDPEGRIRVVNIPWPSKAVQP